MIDHCEAVARLESDDESERIYAAEDIGYVNQPESIGPLVARLQVEPSRAVREAIFSALLQIEDDAVIESTMNLLDSQDPFLRNQAVELLRARGAGTIPYLEKAFRQGNGDKRKFIVDVAARVSASDASAIYDLALRDADINVVITAVEGLGSSRKNQFRDRIERLVLPDTHPMLLSACLEALTEIGEPDTIRTVRKALGEARALPGYLRPSYLKLIGAKGGPEDLRELVSMMGDDELDAPLLNALTSLRNRHPDLRLPAEVALPLQDLVGKQHSPPLAYQAVRLLGALLEEDGVLSFLDRCLDHPQKAVRIGAVQAMLEAGDEKNEAVVRRRLADETDEEVLQALAGKKAE